MTASQRQKRHFEIQRNDLERLRVRNPRVTTVRRRDVFALLQEISKRATLAPSNVEGQIDFLHFMDATINRFIYCDDPFAPDAAADAARRAK